jgi:hypothetical protein
VVNAERDKMLSKLKHELWVLLQFGVISFVATTAAFNTYEADWRRLTAQIYRHNPTDVVSSSPPSINIYEMLAHIWRVYYRQWLFWFLVLAVGRIIFVVVYERSAQYKQNKRFS